jgi:hypothetical protein
MGKQTADAISELDVDLKQQIGYHLRGNFYPPVPTTMTQPCVDALNAFYEGDTKRMIKMPEGVSYKGSDSAPAWAVVEQHHLESWLDEDEDYDN